jgi:hypothetical protein
MLSSWRLRKAAERTPYIPRISITDNATALSRSQIRFARLNSEPRGAWVVRQWLPDPDKSPGGTPQLAGRYCPVPLNDSDCGLPGLLS